MLSLPPSPLGNVPFPDIREAKRLPYEFYRYIGAISIITVGDGSPVPFPPIRTNVTNRAGQGKNDYLRTKHELAARTAGRRGRGRNIWHSAFIIPPR